MPRPSNSGKKHEKLDEVKKIEHGLLNRHAQLSESGPTFSKDAKAVEVVVEPLTQKEPEVIAEALHLQDPITRPIAGINDGRVPLDKESIDMVKRVELSKDD
ncbi:MAG: hypothetical protein M1834_002417 [Cirrosporium novae-zelandiae]|nr:MAG: hypothetical protein M1834_002417 [Cirrosporium novae-zelandiae]